MEAKITYSTEEEWYVTNINRVLRNEEHSTNSLKSIQRVPRDAAFFEAPGRLLANGLHRNYLVFVCISDTEDSSSALEIGQSVQLSYCDLDEKDKIDTPSRKWRGKILSPLPGIDSYGNLTLLVSRPTKHDWTLFVNDVVASNMKIASHPIRLVPTNFDLPVRRLFNTLNQVYEGKSQEHNRLRRFLRARDLSSMDTGASLSLLSTYQPKIDLIESPKSPLSPSQQKSWERIMKSTSFIELITGPFGTGKTTFLAQLAQALFHFGKKMRFCCSSNTAVDTFARKMEETNPSLKAIRFRGLFTETNVLISKTVAVRKNPAKRTEQDSKNIDIFKLVGEDVKVLENKENTEDVKKIGAVVVKEMEKAEPVEWEVTLVIWSQQRLGRAD